MVRKTEGWVFVASVLEAVPSRGPEGRRTAPRLGGNGYYGAHVGPRAMGNIRQTYIKRVAIELIRHHPEAFGGDFAQNKQKVLELTDLGVVVEGKLSVVHKKLANRIAGYATRYMKRKRGT